jgi:alpha-methylacyl-CoA racemase
MSGPLAGTTVLELDFMAPARYTGYLLATLGAEVINIERPAREGGDKSLTFREDTDSRWLWYQQNKKSVVLDVKSPDGREILQRLAERCDVVIEGFRPGAVERMGADYATLSARKPNLIYCSVSAFGQDGPLKDLFGRETAYAACTGLLDLCREQDGAPVMLPFLITDIVGGMHAALAIVAALRHRGRTGEGQYIDASTFDAMFPFLGLRVYDTWLSSWFGSRPRHATSGLETMDTFETKDGRYVVVTPDSQQIWNRFCRAVGRPDLEDARAGLDASASGELRDSARARLSELFKSKTREEWMALNQAINVGVVGVLNLAEALDSAHATARGVVKEIEYPPLGTLKALNIPFKFSKTQPELRGYPQYGGDTYQVIESLGLADRWDELVARKVVA